MRLMHSQEIPSEEPPEFTLISRILAGEKSLFHDLVRPHEIAVYLMAFSVLCNAKEAERAAQRAVLEAFLNLGTLRPGESLRSWLLGFALNEAHRTREERRSTAVL